MRIILTALLTAAAAMPSFASEKPSLPDPTDAAASVPSASVPPIVGSYQSFKDKPVGSWRELNNAVAPSPKKSRPDGMSGMGEMDHSQTSPSTAAPSPTKGAAHGNEKAQMSHDGMAGMDHSQTPAMSATVGHPGAARDNKNPHPKHEGTHE
ncbi:hypothetical protein CBA19CS22_16150 [Caballeronia novacaledonica]|uniref:Uncharacterized protein n=1 Tax=Caballeronia novacaledonica TaxID=1544861 RepID=A0ACB5QTQ4_9BURK|nr:hypothetical protein CBA19CS22_16150 [Caballeronia novacaledonica]